MFKTRNTVIKKFVREDLWWIKYIPGGASTIFFRVISSGVRCLKAGITGTEKHHAASKITFTPWLQRRIIVEKRSFAASILISI